MVLATLFFFKPRSSVEPWQVMLQQDGRQSELMSPDNAAALGYYFMITPGRLVFRTTFGQPYASVKMVCHITKMVCHFPLKGILHYFGNGRILLLPQSETVEFYHFRMYSADFLIFRRISENRQFLVLLTSIVYIFFLLSMIPETVWLLLLFYISENRLNGFENGKTQLLTLGEL